MAPSSNPKMFLLSSLLLLAPSGVRAHDGVSPSSTTTACAAALSASANEDLEKYHGDHVCDRQEYNDFKESLNRHMTYETFKAVPGTMNQVPNQRTLVCPTQVQDLHHETSGNGEHVQGFDVVWLVENTSSEPIVLSFVAKDGVEYSAMNSAIAPAHADPQAILQPGQWKDIRTFEGHVFHARTFDVSTQSLGPVVLQHRAGLVPVGAQVQDLSCPLVDVKPRPLDKRETGEEDVYEEHMYEEVDEDGSAMPYEYRYCNTLDVGFRNMANCPLDAYFVGPSEEDESLCSESMKFHLGTNSVAQDFFYQWDSTTKFQSTWMGQTFQFRSPDGQVVDTMTLEPTRITDCPDLKERALVNDATSVEVAEQVGAAIGNDGQVQDELVTETPAANVLSNSTSSEPPTARPAPRVRGLSLLGIESSTL
mmetsp:Transcript_32832/g.68447  ORF Transcript_32832/g.68447 Transcript_32832/m.68447 type:complete len:422 (-) Transcript_32832:179-1444(-)|eukprot:CAMPEP_0172460018 /NCGR_PEP_ID=MMETSP1065-20121228/35150_1 /TAXON_ID=265537 /ORGANISM="Amphiprora paludosa, Strain CCMP125" /LENGTH=421 /DNA_ID=CAMNT_0013214911 /DNA_START=68 /DNA_END=1333 /DNA_ORIENTATION=-